MSQELLQKGIVVSSGGVRSIWLRNELETMNKRLKALEARSAQEGFVLTEAQIVALEKAKSKREAAGEIETHHLLPGRRLRSNLPRGLVILAAKTPILWGQ